ncbi:MAG: hypothetical protein GX628_10005 [Clostridiales bacterium]|nr:hypothetical protein [Clostridiales bacterium]
MKNTAIMLSLALILALTAALTACGGGTGKTPAADAATAGEATEAVTIGETSSARVEPELPDVAFDGAEFNIYGFSLWGNHYLTAEELTGEVLDDALYERDSRIEDKYDISLRYEIYERDPGKVVNLVVTTVTAGDNAVDLASPSTQNMAGAISDGHFMNLYDVPYLDLSKPWWDADSAEDFSLGGRLYMAVNSMNVLCDNVTAAVFFNKELAESHNLENPYDLVDSGGWTWQKMYEMAKVTSSDLDGDGAMTDLDRYGVVTSSLGLQDAMLNCGEPVIAKDKEDYPVLALGTSRSAEVAETIFNIMNDAQNVIWVDKYQGKYKDAWQDLMYPMFKEGRGMFISRAYVQYVNYFRDSEVDYGILPRPKYDEKQERYYHDVNNYWANCIVVPAAVESLEMTGVITEALAAESLYGVTPANYDMSIVNKQLRDVDSERMLKIIYSSRVFDYGQITSWSSMKSKLQNMVKTGSFTFASDYAADKTAAEVGLEKFIEQMKALK